MTAKYSRQIPAGIRGDELRPRAYSHPLVSLPSCPRPRYDEQLSTNSGNQFPPINPIPGLDSQYPKLFTMVIALRVQESGVSTSG